LRIPKQITIAGKKWRIYHEREAPKRLIRKISPMYQSGTLGLTEFSSREIVLADGLTPEQEGVTLIHELLHAIYHVSNDENLGAELEERVIEALDEHLYSVVLQLIQNETTKGTP